MSFFKKEKNIFYVIAIILVVILAIISQVMHIKNNNGIPKQTDLIYVNDFANVLSDDTKEYIINFNKYLSSKKEKPQIIVATIDSFGSHLKWDYLNKMFNEYNVNGGSRNNGILIVFSEKNNKMYVKSLMKHNSKSMRTKILYLRESSNSILKDGDIDKAVLNIFKNASNLICYQYDYDSISNDTVGFTFPATTEMMLNVALRYKLYTSIIVLVIFSEIYCLVKRSVLKK